MDNWRTAIATSDDTHIWIHGYDVTDLMAKADFTDTIFLLHRGRLPNYGERRILNAILIAVADHGAGAPSCAAARLAASGNRQSPSAAVAAGVLAIGDEHGGAGSACMELIAAGVELSRRDSISIEEAARRITADAVANKRRLPGLGHRVHSTDPRKAVLFRLASDASVTGKGVAFMEALEQAAGEKIKPLLHEHRWSVGRGALRPRFPPSSASDFHHRARGRTHRRGGGRVCTREGQCASGFQ